MDDTTALHPSVLAYYEEGREHARLEQADRLEFLRTQELLTRFLPPPPAHVADVGGGAGIHAVPLIAAGYDVSLIDAVPLHVEQARAAGVADAQLGDARRLPLDDASVDAVLLLGPLYHLVDRDDRVAAWREAARVVRPGGLVLAAAISRFASAHEGLRHGILTDPEFAAIVEQDLASGRHANPNRRSGWFTTAYFHQPEELSGELTDAGLTREALLAIEGPGSFLVDIDDWLVDPDRREALLRLIRRTEAEPSLLGASSHLLAVGRAA
jgi:SAM-dependent methyltransferase